MSKLTVDIRVGDTLKIGTATVQLKKKSGQIARLEVTADPSTEIKVPKNTARMSALQPAANGAHHGQHTLRQGSPALPGSADKLDDGHDQVHPG